MTFHNQPGGDAAPPNSRSPKVSIVIPVYNGADYLASAIDSALGQSYRDIEVIVVNDGSTDNGATEAIALSYGSKVRYYRKSNGHVASALNFGIRHMSGEYFSWLSHDDLYKPNKVASQVGALCSFPANTLAYSDFEVLDVATGATTPVHMKSVCPEHFRYHITLDNSLHGCTLLIPKAALDAAGPFNETLRTTQDYDMWFRLSRQCRFVHVPGILVTARHHAQQGTIALLHLAQPECDRLLSKFVTELTVREVEAASGNDPARAYLVIASNLKDRGFPAASGTAMSLALSHVKRYSPPGKLRFWGERLYRSWVLRPAIRFRRKVDAVTRRFGRGLQ